MILDNFNGAFPEGSGYELLQAKDVAWNGQSEDDKTALKIVLQDVARSETFIQTKGFKMEWLHAENLYLALVPIQDWEGTQVPRSRLGVNLVYEHIESIMPQVMLGIFTDDPPFGLKNRPGTKAETARANQALLNWELDMCATGGFREEFRKLTKSALQYGMGIGKWGWVTYSKRRRQLKRKQAPVGTLGTTTEES